MSRPKAKRAVHWRKRRLVNRHRFTVTADKLLPGDYIHATMEVVRYTKIRPRKRTVIVQTNKSINEVPFTRRYKVSHRRAP